MKALAPFRQRMLTFGMISLAVVSVTSGTMVSLALFTDQETDDATTTAGSIILDATKIDSLDLTVSAMMPGDTKRSPVTVENDGSAQLRYAVSQTSTNADSLDIRSTLTLEIKTEDTGAGAFGTDGDYCDDANGTSVRAAAALGASANLVGNPTQGSQAGDRTLNAGASEVLCFYVVLPLSAANSLQSATTTTTYTFDAEQTSNNP